MKQILTLCLFAIATIQAAANEADRDALVAIMKDVSNFFLTGEQTDAEEKFKALLGNDQELEVIYGKYSASAIKERDNFLKTAGHEHYWKIHTASLRKAGEIRTVEIVERLNLFTQQMKEKGYIDPELPVLMVASQDTGGTWDSYEFAWVKGRWVMLSPSAYEIMTKPEKFK